MNVGVVGLGAVGEIVAHALVLTDTAARLVLVNRTIETAKAIERDLTQARPWGRRVTIESLPTADASVLGECDLVVMALGPRLRGDEERNAKFAASRKMCEAAGLVQTVTALASCAQPPILLVVTNPVEPVVTWLQRGTGYSSQRLIGLGCTVESARLACHEAERRRIAPKDVALHVVGEHGPTIAAVRPDGTAAPGVEAALQLVRGDAAMIRGLSEVVGKRRAQRLLEQMKHDVGALPQDIQSWLERELPSQLTPPATRFAIATCAVAVARAIRDDERSVLAVSALPPDDIGLPPVAIALPYVVGRQGIAGCVVPAPMPDAVREAAAVIKGLVDAV